MKPSNFAAILIVQTTELGLRETLAAIYSKKQVHPNVFETIFGLTNSRAREAVLRMLRSSRRDQVPNLIELLHCYHENFFNTDSLEQALQRRPLNWELPVREPENLFDKWATYCLLVIDEQLEPDPINYIQAMIERTPQGISPRLIEAMRRDLRITS